MERWLEPLYDAEAMRAVDSWAIEGAGVPSLELMETAGRALAEVAERHATGGPVRVVCGKGNNGGDGLVAARHLAGAGHEVEVLLLWPAAELSADATANLDRFDGEVRELAVGEAEAALAGSGVVDRRDLRHRLQRRAARPGRRRDRGDQRLRRPRGRRRHRLRRRRLDRRGRGRGGRRRARRSAFTPPSSATGSRRASATPGELEVAPIGIPDGAPDRPSGGLIRTSVLELLAGARPGLDQVHLRAGADRRRLARAHRAPPAWPPPRRPAPAPATRPSPFRPSSSPSSR